MPDSIRLQAPLSIMAAEEEVADVLQELETTMKVRASVVIGYGGYVPKPQRTAAAMSIFDGADKHKPLPPIPIPIPTLRLTEGVPVHGHDAPRDQAHQVRARLRCGLLGTHAPRIG